MKKLIWLESDFDSINHEIYLWFKNEGMHETANKFLSEYRELQELIHNSTNLPDYWDKFNNNNNNNK